MVQILLAKAARAEQRSLDFWPNAVHYHLQLIASTTEGPAEPSVCKAEVQMTLAVMLSKRMHGMKVIIGWLITLESICMCGACIKVFLTRISLSVLPAVDEPSLIT